MGLVCFGVMTALGEMATLLPHKKGFGGYAARFIDPAAGFAVGWNYLYVASSRLLCAVLTT